MSIQAFKKKGVINYGSRRSAKGPGGVWLPQGPFGADKSMLSLSLNNQGPVGFSINGGTRNKGRVGQSMAMSKSGTPYRGQFPCWSSGGIRGRYPQEGQLFNSPLVKAINEGSQAKYIKPSVLSNKGMLEKKYMWINNGQYPNAWVQPVYPNSNLSDNASQWLYIDKKAAANICVNDTNKPQVYVNHRIKCGPTGCSTTSAKYPSYNIMSSNVGYTKTLGIPQTSSQYTLQIQRKCSNPVGPQKPFPFATNSGLSNGKITIRGPPPPVYVPDYLTPPDWYWYEKEPVITPSVI